MTLVLGLWKYGGMWYEELNFLWFHRPVFSNQRRLKPEGIRQDNSPVLRLCHSLDFIFHLVSLSIDWLEVQKSHVIFKYNLSINWRRWTIAAPFYSVSWSCPGRISQRQQQRLMRFIDQFIQQLLPTSDHVISRHSVIAGRLKVRSVKQ